MNRHGVTIRYIEYQPSLLSLAHTTVAVFRNSCRSAALIQSLPVKTMNKYLARWRSSSALCAYCTIAVPHPPFLENFEYEVTTDVYV